mgnify:CR=1 FL=1
MIAFDTKTHNVTVLLKSAGNSLAAEGELVCYRNIKQNWSIIVIDFISFPGTYKSTENETFVDVGFDINGTKHLDASFGYAIKKFQYGYTISPQMHLIVNNERVAAFSGFISIDLFIVDSFI